MMDALAQPPGLAAYLLLGALLFSIGLYGVLSRKNTLAILIAIELMANAVNINLVAFSRFSGTLQGQGFALFSIALTVAEVVIGLAIIVLMYRAHKRIDADAPSALRKQHAVDAGALHATVEAMCNHPRRPGLQQVTLTRAMLREACPSQDSGGQPRAFPADSPRRASTQGGW